MSKLLVILVLAALVIGAILFYMRREPDRPRRSPLPPPPCACPARAGSARASSGPAGRMVPATRTRRRGRRRGVFRREGGHRPAPATGTATARDTIGVFRPSDRGFYLRNGNASGTPDAVVYFGAAGVPVVGDWNGDGSTRSASSARPIRPGRSATATPPASPT